jgi:uncharacterized protein (TIGR03067 family)
MNRMTIAAVLCFGTFWSAVIRADESAAKEAQLLEGVWVSKPPAKGRGRGHVLYIQGGKLGWESFQTRDGEKIIGHGKLYDFTVDPKATPKKITLKLGKGKDRITRLGAYELDEDTLKIAVGPPDKKEAPKTVTDEDSETLVLTRDKAAKVPKLDQPEGEDVRIDATAQWAGEVRDAEVEKKCPSAPVTTQAEFEKVWKVLRADEKLPKVDFSKEFVLIKTWTGSKITKFGLILDSSGEIDSAITVGPPSKVDGFTYVIAVFQRDVIDTVDGKLVPKKRK